MAVLYDQRERFSLTIEPVTPTLTGPRNAYHVNVRDKEQTIFERQYTTYPGTPDGHWYIWRLIRAFLAATQLVDAKTNINISTSGDDDYREDVILRASTGWLTVEMHGRTQRGRYPQPYERLCFFVDVYLLEGSQLEQQEQPLNTFVQIGLSCSPHAVEDFGNALLTECQEARKVREALGIPASADDYLD